MSDVAFLFCYEKFGLHKKLKLNPFILLKIIVGSHFSGEKAYQKWPTPNCTHITISQTQGCRFGITELNNSQYQLSWP